MELKIHDERAFKANLLAYAQGKRPKMSLSQRALVRLALELPLDETDLAAWQTMAEDINLVNGLCTAPFSLYVTAQCDLLPQYAADVKAAKMALSTRKRGAHNRTLRLPS